MKRFAIVSVSFVALTLLAPLAARAEVSVQLTADGKVARVVVLNRGGRVWRQVRGHVASPQLLNPLGDTYGDLAPVVAMHPITRQPWAVWPQNEGNRKRLVASSWNGTGWTAPERIAQSDLMGFDQTEPRLVFDAAGVPYVFFTEGAHDRRILFVTLSSRGWTPPLRMSDDDVDSSGPTALLNGDDIRLSYQTPAGSMTRLMSTTFLTESAFSLMDSPIPPGYMPIAPPENPGSASEEPGDTHVKRR